MAVYYKFKSAKDYDSIPIEGQFISVANLKERIFESKHLGRGTDFDLMVSNAQTDEEYVDEAGMIPKNTSVLIRRVPGRPRKPIVTERAELKIVEEKVEDILPSSSSMVAGDSSAMKYPEEFEWDEFGNDLYSIPEVHHHAQPIVPIVDVTPADKADEDSKIRALVDTPALDWNRQGHDSYGAGRGFGRGMGGRMMAGRGFGRVGLEKKTPPAGYICHRCKIAGHFIQHCPTNGDPNYDIRRVKPPTGIPRSMLMANPDGSYALPSGAVAVLKPNEAAFEREIEGLPSTRSISDLPPELHCPLCKEVMKDAVLTSKCCFKSFCDKCIRNYIISNSKCVCGAMNVLADDLLPNKTLRDTISRILETTTSSTENAGFLAHVQDTESARYGQPRVPSPTLSNASKCEPKLLPPAPTAEAVAKQPSPDIKECEAFTEAKADYNVPTQLFDKKLDKTMDSARTTPDSTNARDAANTEENLEKLPPGEQGKKKKKKKTRIAAAGADMQWRGFQDFGVENFAGMPVGPSAYNPYWSNGMPIGIEGFMPPIAAAPMPYIGYAPSPFDVAFGGIIPHDPFAAAQGYMIPAFPQRDLAELGMNGYGMNQQGPPLVSREEFDSRKAEMRRKREMDRAERLGERDQKPREREKVASGKDSAVGVGTFDAPPPALNKPRLRSEAANVDRLDREPEDRPDRSANMDRHGGSKRRSSDRERESDGAERKQKGSVFSRISFPADGGKRKKSSPSDPANGRRNCESSDDERHFKRRSSSRREEERDEEGASSSRLSRASREPKRRL